MGSTKFASTMAGPRENGRTFVYLWMMLATIVPSETAPHSVVIYTTRGRHHRMSIPAFNKRNVNKAPLAEVVEFPHGHTAMVRPSEAQWALQE